MFKKKPTKKTYTKSTTHFVRQKKKQWWINLMAH